MFGLTSKLGPQNNQKKTTTVVESLPILAQLLIAFVMSGVAKHVQPHVQPTCYLKCLAACRRHVHLHVNPHVICILMEYPTNLDNFLIANQLIADSRG